MFAVFCHSRPPNHPLDSTTLTIILATWSIVINGIANGLDLTSLLSFLEYFPRVHLTLKMAFRKALDSGQLKQLPKLPAKIAKAGK